MSTNSGGPVSGLVEDGMDAPIKKMIDIMKLLKNSTTSARLKKQIDHVITILGTGDIYSTQLDNLESEILDDDVKDWINTTFIGRNTPAPGSNKLALRPRGFSNRLAQPMDSKGATQLNNDAMGAIEYISLDVLQFDDIQTSRIREYLSQSGQWDFDIFGFAEATFGHPLLYLSYYMIKKLRILEDFKVEEISLLQYLDEIEMTYQRNPYHNSVHAADMLQAMWVFLNDDRLNGVLTRLELLAVILACTVHDVDHPGVTNAFVVKTRHPLAILYSDISVLECHHAATGITTAERRQLFNKLGPVYDDLRKLWIDLVLATDMGKHFEILNRFKSQLAAASDDQSGLKLDKAEVKLMVLHVAVKCSDLSNPTRPRDTSLCWTDRIMEEFYQQGDQERALGLPISKFMDRQSQADENVAKCQTSFIDVIVAPLYQVWSTYLQSPIMLEVSKNIQANRAYWASPHRSKENLRDSFSSSGKMNDASAKYKRTNLNPAPAIRKSAVMGEGEAVSTASMNDQDKSNHPFPVSESKSSTQIGNSDIRSFPRFPTDSEYNPSTLEDDSSGEHKGSGTESNLSRLNGSKSSVVSALSMMNKDDLVGLRGRPLGPGESRPHYRRGSATIQSLPPGFMERRTSISVLPKPKPIPELPEGKENPIIRMHSENRV
jgi:hypothetical protein